MDQIIAVVVIVLWLVWLVGSVLPVLPWPLLGYLGMIILYFFSDTPPTPEAMLRWLWWMIILTVIDYLLPLWFTKWAGFSRYASWWSVVGAIVWLFVFPPFGLLIGPFVGAYLWEYYHVQDHRNAVNAARKSLLWSLWSIVIKVCVAAMILRYLFSLVL